jgi:ribose transport system substrate-binding protein
MKKALSVMLALALVLSVFSFAVADDNPTYNFEIVSKGFQSTYWQAVYKGATNEVDKINADAGYDKVTIHFVGPDSESDIAQQVNEFESALNAKPDAIGLAALDVSALNEDIASAQAAGIPIIGFDSGVPDAPEGAVLANASTDNYAAGQVAAENLYAKIKDRIAAATSAVRIGEVNQDATSESITSRGIGFIDKMIELLNADGYKVALTGNDKYVGDATGDTVDESEANVIIEVRVPAQTTTELCATEAGVILNEADTIAIFGSNQVSAEGIITADETLSVCGSEDSQIIAVGFDSGAVIKAAVTAGTMYGAVTQAPVAIGEKLIDLLLVAASGEDVADVDTGCQFYTAENIASEEIAQNLYD